MPYAWRGGQAQTSLRKSWLGGTEKLPHPAPPGDRTQDLRIWIPTLGPLIYVPNLRKIECRLTDFLWNNCVCYLYMPWYDLRIWLGVKNQISMSVYLSKNLSLRIVLSCRNQKHLYFNPLCVLIVYLRFDLIMIIIVLMGTFISVFSNHFKAPQDWKLWSLLPITTLLFTFTLQKYIYPSVIMWMIILKVQVNGPKRWREQTGVHGEKPLWKPVRSRYPIIIWGSNQGLNPVTL